METSGIHTDFELFLVLFCAITGAIWLLDLLWLRKRRAQGRPEPKLVEFARSFFPVVFAVLVLRSFVVEPFRIPSGSMMPTLYNGDFILVNKYTYGIRLPVVHTKILPISEPQRGDVVVFRWPVDPGKDFIKRVVGLPGDTITYKDKQLYINGKQVTRVSDGEFSNLRAPQMYGAKQYTEVLGEAKHDILLMPSRGSMDGTVTVPPRHYFVMGDNRDRSDDSRMWGFVPEENLLGRAFMIWMSWNPVEDSPVWGRIGKAID